AAWEFSKQYPGPIIYGTEQNVRMANILSLLDNVPEQRNRFHSLAKARQEGMATTQSIRQQEDRGAFAVIDLETIDWGSTPRIQPKDLPSCWQFMTQLRPTGFGAGERVALLVRYLADFLPRPVGTKLGESLDAVITPRPARVYYVPSGCSLS